MLRSVLDLLLGPPHGSPARDSVRWRWVPLRLIGPGSVPLALCLTAIGDAFVSDHYTNDRLSLIFALIASVPVVLAGYRPLLAWVVSFGAFWVFAGSTAPVDTPQPWPWVPTALLAYLVVQFAVARTHGPAIGLSTWIGPILAGTLLALARGVPDATPNLQLMAVLAGFAIALGSGIRLRRRARARLEQEEQVAAEERTRRQVLEEKARIARELHDIVAHHMSVIVLQASSAPARLADTVEVAAPIEAEFDAIARSGRESLTEMRRLLAVLRSADDRTEREPQPGIENLDRLVGSTRAAGTPVRVEGAGDLPADLSETVSLTAYRIVQEALSNVVRHAPHAPTTIRLGVEGERLEVTVTNEASGGTLDPTGNARVDPVEPADSGPGLGLLGMRERVDLLGGELSYGRPREGGFTVRAVLPLAAGLPADTGALADTGDVGQIENARAGSDGPEQPEEKGTRG